MKIVRLIDTVDTHTAGEPTRIVTSGLPPLPGATMAEKRDYFAANFDQVRSLLTQEPRGHSAMHVAVLTSPTQPEADAAALIMNASGFLNMCGHGTLGVATVLVELGMVNVVEPVTHLNFETLGGLIPLRYASVCSYGRRSAQPGFSGRRAVGQPVLNFFYQHSSSRLKNKEKQKWLRKTVT